MPLRLQNALMDGSYSGFGLLPKPARITAIYPKSAKPAMPSTAAPWRRGQQPNGPSLPIGEDTAQVTPSDLSYGNASGTEGDEEGPAFLDQDGEEQDNVPASTVKSYIRPQNDAEDEIGENVIAYYASRNPMLVEVSEAFKSFVSEMTGMVQDYTHSRMAKDFKTTEPWDGSKPLELMKDRLKKCSETYRMNPEKLSRVIEMYSDLKLNPTPDEDLKNDEYQIDGTNTTRIILSPELNYSGSSGLDGHELGDYDHKEAMRRHLRKRLHSLRYHKAAADLKDQETDATVQDADLERYAADNNLEAGQPPAEWEQILNSRRKRLKGLNSDSVMSDPGSSGNDNVNGFAYSEAD